MNMTTTIRFVPGPEPVEVTFNDGEVVRFAGLHDAESFLDFLQNNPPENRGEKKYEAVSRLTKPGRGME